MGKHPEKARSGPSARPHKGLLGLFKAQIRLFCPKRPVLPCLHHPGNYAWEAKGWGQSATPCAAPGSGHLQRGGHAVRANLRSTRHIALDRRAYLVLLEIEAGLRHPAMRSVLFKEDSRDRSVRVNLSCMGKHPEKARSGPSERPPKGLLGLLIPQFGLFCQKRPVLLCLHHHPGGLPQLLWVAWLFDTFRV